MKKHKRIGQKFTVVGCPEEIDEDIIPTAVDYAQHIKVGTLTPVAALAMALQRERNGRDFGEIEPETVDVVKPDEGKNWTSIGKLRSDIFFRAIKSKMEGRQKTPVNVGNAVLELLRDWG